MPTLKWGPPVMCLLDDDGALVFTIDGDGLHAHQEKARALEAALRQTRTCPECGHVR